MGTDATFADVCVRGGVRTALAVGAGVTVGKGEIVGTGVIFGTDVDADAVITLVGATVDEIDAFFDSMADGKDFTCDEEGGKTRSLFGAEN